MLRALLLFLVTLLFIVPVTLWLLFIALLERIGIKKVVPNASDAQIEEALQPFRERLRQSERALARISLTAITDDLPWISKLGGAPYLEIGECLPLADDQRAMVLLAQINFAELPTLDGYPTLGLLQFFIASEMEDGMYGIRYGAETPEAHMAQHSFRLRYIAEPLMDVSRLQRIEPPDIDTTTPHNPAKPRAMRFAPAREAISPQDAGFRTWLDIDVDNWCKDQAQRLGVASDDFRERAFPDAGGHKVGGYPTFAQEDPRPADSPLRLLLQLDSDDDLMWGDCGVGAFFIDPVDLARADFSRVLYNWDGH